MNIGMLIWHHRTGRGGLEKTAGSLTAFLAAQGHTVHIFYNQLEGEKTAAPYYPHPETLCHNLALQRENPQLERARALIAQQRLDVFVAHFSWHDMLWVPPLLHNSGIPLVYAEHSDPHIIQNQRWNKAEHLACASAADRIVLLFDEFRAAYPHFLQSRIAIIPNAVAKPAQTASPERPGAGGFTLLAAGRLVEECKQFSVLIAAFAILAKAFPNWHLRLCGDGANMQDYQQFAAELGIADRVSFPGMIQDMGPEYAAAHLFCIPSRYEGFGMVTLEAQSHGLPAVGFAECSGTNSLIRHEHNGLLAPEMTVDSLAATLRPLMKNHTLRSIMGKNGKKAAEAYFPEAIGKKWEQLLVDASAKTGTTRLEFALDQSDEAKAKLMLHTVLLRKNPFAPKSFFSGHKAFSSEEYWENRYKNNGNSGPGSYNHLAAFKAEVINGFIATHAITTAIEFGAGDGNQLSLLSIPQYMGFDVSETIVQKLRTLFSTDSTKTFFHTSEFAEQKAQLVLSIDVLFHLVEDAVFENYMRSLFAAAAEHVIIYSSNSDTNGQSAPHVRHRKFTKWIAENIQGWECTGYIQNPYKKESSAPDSDDASFCDFFIYSKTTNSHSL